MGSSAPDFTWTLTSPGRWERDVDEVEQFYTSLAKAYEGTGRVFFAMTGYIAFSVEIPNTNPSQEPLEEVTEALRKAWLRLRYDHPTIASTVEFSQELKTCRKIYETCDRPESQQDWLRSTFQVVSNGMSGLDWCNSDPPVPQKATLFLIIPAAQTPGEVRGELVLRCHHDIIDGVGTLILFDNLFAHAEQAYAQGSQYQLPRFGEESAHLSPPLRIAAAIPAALQPEQKAYLDTVRPYQASLREGVEVATMPFDKSRTFPGKHQRIAVTLSREPTRRLLAACKAMGWSVTHAYHAAAAITVRDLQERQDQERMVRYINYSLINERPQCTPPYSTTSHAATAYHSVSGKGLAVDLRVPARDSITDQDDEQRAEFVEVANKVRDFYQQIRNDKQHIQLVPSYWAMATLPYPADGATPPVPEINSSPSVSISSMGVVDRIIRPVRGAFKLDNPWVTGEELGTGLGLFLGTWEGRLTLSAAYNDAWHGLEEVVDFVEHCHSLVLRALGVSRNDG